MSENYSFTHVKQFNQKFSTPCMECWSPWHRDKSKPPQRYLFASWMLHFSTGCHSCELKICSWWSIFDPAFKRSHRAPWHLMLCTLGHFWFDFISWTWVFVTSDYECAPFIYFSDRFHVRLSFLLGFSFFFVLCLQMMNYSVKTPFMLWPTITDFASEKTFWHGLNCKSLGEVIIGIVLLKGLAELEIPTSSLADYLYLCNFLNFSSSFKDLDKFFFGLSGTEKCYFIFPGISRIFKDCVNPAIKQQSLWTWKWLWWLKRVR